MQPDSLVQIENKDVHNTQRFEQRKGYFIIEALPIMTQDQVVTIEQEYTLIEFGNAGKIDYRTVIFWYASLKQGMLKLICYDNNNKVLIQKIHDIDNPDDATNWFLVSDDFFDGELLEFQF